VDTTIVKETRSGDGIAHAGRRALETREQRALAFYRERGGEVTRMGDSLYRVPSFSQANVEYLVDYEDETCTCPAGTCRPSIPCQHVLLVGVLRAKEHMRRRRNFASSLVAEEG
jgi:hypothetical protein